MGRARALQDAANSAGGAGIVGPTPGVATDGTGALRIAQNAALTSGGSYPGGTALDFGGRSTGRYEMLWTIGSARLDSGDANGATAGFGLRDGEAGTDLFRIRLNKTTGGLAISTYVDSTYTTVRSFGGQYQLGGRWLYARLSIWTWARRRFLSRLVMKPKRGRSTSP
jgi:hypothetical protein